MSYDVYLRDDEGEVCTTEAHSEGGTYTVGGTDECHLNVTYNYSQIFRIIKLQSFDGVFSF